MLTAARQLYREWRGGELSVLLWAMTLAVAIVTGIGLFSERLDRAIGQRSSELLGADLVLESPRPLSESLVEQVARHQLALSRTVSFTTMVSVDERFQISSVSAVDSAYPLQGRVALLGNRGADKRLRRGRIWAEQRLYSSLGIAPGDRVELGESALVAEETLARAPGGFSLQWSLGPRILMHLDDLPQTGVLSPGSRVAHRYYITGEPERLEAWREAVAPLLLPEHRIHSVGDGRPGLAGAIARARSYLMLASALGVALAGAAMAIAARRYARLHRQPVAILKTLGAGNRQIAVLYACKLSGVALFAVVAGIGAGWLLQQLIVAVSDVAAELQGVSGDAGGVFRLAAATVLVSLSAFVLPPLWQLRRVPPVAVLRGDQLSGTGQCLSPVAALAGVAALIGIYTDELKLSVAVLAGLLVVAGLAACLAWLLIQGSRRLPFRAGNAWLLATSSLRRRGLENALLAAVFSIPLMLVLLLMSTRETLTEQWAQQIPERAPNHFLVNIPPTSHLELASWLADNQLPHAGFYPVVRARLARIDGVAVRADGVDGSASSALNRELNLSSAARLPDDNTLVSGAWWKPGVGAGQVSVEQDLAEGLGLRVGSLLTFQVGAEPLQLRVSSIRGVNWENMRPAFYMLLSPGSLRPFHATYMTSFYLPPAQQQRLVELVRLFPSVTVIDIEAMVSHVRSIVRQISRAVAAILWAVVVCAVLVLFAAVELALPERCRESAVLRTLGASAGFIQGSIGIEFLLLGMLAGAIAALGAAVIGAMVTVQLFELDWQIQWALWLQGPIAGGVLIAAIGVLANRRVVSQSPVISLRALDA